MTLPNAFHDHNALLHVHTIQGGVKVLVEIGSESLPAFLTGVRSLSLGLVREFSCLPAMYIKLLDCVDHGQRV